MTTISISKLGSSIIVPFGDYFVFIQFIERTVHSAVIKYQVNRRNVGDSFKSNPVTINIGRSVDVQIFKGSTVCIECAEKSIKEEDGKKLTFIKIS